MQTLELRTFLIVSAMLLITAFSSKKNKAFETQWEFWGLVIAMFALIFIIPATPLPINLGLTLVFAVVVGLIVGPGIRGMMMNFVVRKQLLATGYTKERLKVMPAEEQKQLVEKIQGEINNGAHESLADEWNNVVAMAVYATAGITLAAAFVVYAFDFNFSFLGQFLLIALLGLIVVGLLNIFFFKSPLLRLISAYIGAVIFSLYLLYDFDRLKAAADGATWETAVNLSISIYLDIINLFLDLLQILSDSN